MGRLEHAVLFSRDVANARHETFYYPIPTTPSKGVEGTTLLNDPLTTGAKSELAIDLPTNATSSLAALTPLSCADTALCYHGQQNVRLPLGIYNTSLIRICGKVRRCCNKLESYFLRCKSIDALSNEGELRGEIVDYLELCIYAAAEHVDDIDLIAKGFYGDPRGFKKARPVKLLRASLKPLRDRVSAYANAIKHSQSRLRLFSTEFSHESQRMCLHGFFVEAVIDGTIRPHPIFHSNDQHIFSITSFLWEILVFLALASRQLKTFLDQLSVAQGSTLEAPSCSPYAEAVIALARLPLYSFDDTHPFQTTRVIVTSNDQVNTRLASSIYGSIASGWSKSSNGAPGRARLEYEGDGSTKSFHMTAPRKLALQHWE